MYKNIFLRHRLRDISIYYLQANIGLEITMLKKLCTKKGVLCAVLCLGVLLCLSPVMYSQANVMPTAAAKKKLPVYCVDTQGKKQVAITFDAAWGADDTDT